MERRSVGRSPEGHDALIGRDPSDAAGPRPGALVSRVARPARATRPARAARSGPGASGRHRPRRDWHGARE
jgi:hypothetical protein